MSIDSNYNNQFIQIDFRLLDNPEFLHFVTRAEFATYLILRRYVWRGGRHRLGLHELYSRERKLACSIGASRIAALLGLNDETRVSKHLSYLASAGVLQRVRTGRDSIFILGEWYRPPGWTVSKEYYYLENRFGVEPEMAGEIVAKSPGSDLAQNAKSDLAEMTKSDLHPRPNQSWLKKPSSNREENKEKNTVNGVIQLLPKQDITTGHRASIVADIVDELGDSHSRRFYELVAATIPEHVIRRTLSEIRSDGAREPAKLFTYRVQQYALERLKRGIGDSSKTT